MLYFPLFILPIISGYFYLTSNHRFAYKLARTSDQQIYFQTVNAGTWIFLLSCFFYFIFHWVTKVCFLDYSWTQSASKTFETILTIFSSKPHYFTLNIFLISLVFPIFLGWALNKNYGNKNFKDKLLYLEKILEHDDVELKLIHSMQKGLPVYITMMCGKVYIGFPNKQPNVKLKRHSLEIFPLASGYRDVEKHNLEITTYYFKVYQNIDNNKLTTVNKSDFNVVIRSDQIQSIGLFSFEVYANKERYFTIPHLNKKTSKSTKRKTKY